jgi:hypothetical protein
LGEPLEADESGPVLDLVSLVPDMLQRWRRRQKCCWWFRMKTMTMRACGLVCLEQ